MTTRDNVVLFHARAIRDYCKEHFENDCKDCIFYQLRGDVCHLIMSCPTNWSDIERRDLDNGNN